MSTSPRQIYSIPITWTNNKSQPILVADFRNVGLTAVGTGSITVLASKQYPSGGKDGNREIDFSAPSTIDNSYTQVVVYDETITTGNWVTALAVSGSTKIAELDINELTWICLSRSGGGVDAFITVSDNQ